jgi:hypothetical protein
MTTVEARLGFTAAEGPDDIDISEDPE